MSRRSELLLLRNPPRSLAMGALVAVVAVGVMTLVIYPLSAVAPAVSLGVVYLLAVLLVSTYGGLWLGLVTAVFSAATFNWFHIPPTGRFHVAESQNWVALGVFLAAAVIASSVADVARSRAADAQRRREEADLAAEMARTLLGGANVTEALAYASRRLADTLGLRFAAIELTAVAPGSGERAIHLELGVASKATLLVPADLDEGTRQRLNVGVVPSLEALLTATLERERLQREVVESQALRRSDVLKTALLRAVSHDLRSPLTAIIAAGDAVRSPTVEPGEREELASMIVGEATRLSRMVEQLLDLSRLEAGTVEPRPDWCSIEESVAAAIEHFDRRDAGMTIDVAIDGRLPFIEADAAQLERVFVNLLDNALRFSRGHPVEVHAREANGSVVVRVIDHGRGIPADALPNVFDAFWRDGDGTEHAGSGLGLAIVKGLVEANGGRARVDSELGRGSVFTLDFPISAAGAASSLEPSAS